jgi:imidazoleglycerol phosphate dehydratase HisB
MALSKKVIWEQVFPEDAELRIQQAFEMLLGEEFGLTDYARFGTPIDQCFSNDYNQANEKPTINVRGNRQQVKSIQKVDS